jgi:selenocysteine lyase/cysteine desulfurase
MAAFMETRKLLAAGSSALGGWPTSSNAFERLRDQYSLSPEITYFNHASIGTIPRPVQKARQKYFEQCETNPWLYIWGGAWDEALQETRETAARILRCSAEEIAITHNTTEGFNLLANGLPLGRGDEVVFGSMNHAGAGVCWHHYAETCGFSVKSFEFPILEVPRLTQQEILDVYDRHISKSTRVLVFPHIDNIVGLRHPVRELAALARDKGVEFVAVDGAQSVGMIPVDVTSMDVDFYSVSPHKWLQSPKGQGLMYLRKESQSSVRPMWVTFGQERWKGTVRIFEDYGTKNLPDILTLGDSMKFRENLGVQAIDRRLESLWRYFRDGVEKFPQLIWRSPTDWESSASLYAIEYKGKKSRDVFDTMYESHGYVFRPFETQGLSSMRISPDVSNTEEEMGRFFNALKQID